MQNRILTFFILSISLFAFLGCVHSPLANPNMPYPKLTYAESRNTDIVPQDFANTFINRFKILYEQSPNANLKEVRFYFKDYYNEARGDFSPTALFSFTPRYLMQLNVQVITFSHTQNFTQNYQIPVIGFNPPYSQNFDGLILKILQE
ncbi:hypothetical protein [Helicobacter rodentium]|uniref:hypothetical protein n=1 Tax=Helicobacter rodentium TaxID=59617 RepID=UPI0004786FC1|nr:hypothetical protein [Helicobacter rodentium]